MYGDLTKKRSNNNRSATLSTSNGKSKTYIAGAQRSEIVTRKKSRGKYVLGICGVLIAVCIILFGVVVSNDNEALGVEGGTAGGAASLGTGRKNALSNDGEYGPKIKGLRLGMDYDDVDAVVKRLCDQHNSSSPKYPVCVSHEGGNLILHSVAKNTGNYCQFRFDDEKLAWFELKGEILQLAFGVSPDSISDKQLLQLFLDNYGIPGDKTRIFTFSAQNGSEMFGYYDGSESEGYAFKFRGYRGTINGIQSWSFILQRFVGWDFDMPAQISMSDVKNYQHGFGPVIKGFQLGMTRAEVMKMVRKIWKTAKPTEEGDMVLFKNGGTFADLTFRFKNDRVYKFNITGELFMWLFRADPKHEILENFVQRVVDNYNLPRLEKKSKGTSYDMATCYECTINGIEFWVEESRKLNWANWMIGCRRIDASKFD